jgi:hypothetical protein
MAITTRSIEPLRRCSLNRSHTLGTMTKMALPCSSTSTRTAHFNESNLPASIGGVAKREPDGSFRWPIGLAMKCSHIT